TVFSDLLWVAPPGAARSVSAKNDPPDHFLNAATPRSAALIVTGSRAYFTSISNQGDLFHFPYLYFSLRLIRKVGYNRVRAEPALIFTFHCPLSTFS
ncbi:MAG: hypothetical protein IJJ85_06670, partial [Clostridia bacterium]|nr:hypothetical protein [Clostridia bacterium]